MADNRKRTRGDEVSQNLRDANREAILARDRANAKRESRPGRAAAFAKKALPAAGAVLRRVGERVAGGGLASSARRSTLLAAQARRAKEGANRAGAAALKGRKRLARFEQAVTEANRNTKALRQGLAARTDAAYRSAVSDAVMKRGRAVDEALARSLRDSSALSANRAEALAATKKAVEDISDAAYARNRAAFDAASKRVDEINAARKARSDLAKEAHRKLNVQIDKEVKAGKAAARQERRLAESKARQSLKAARSELSSAVSRKASSPAVRARKLFDPRSAASSVSSDRRVSAARKSVAEARDALRSAKRIRFVEPESLTAMRRRLASASNELGRTRYAPVEPPPLPPTRPPAAVPASMEQDINRMYQAGKAEIDRVRTASIRSAADEYTRAEKAAAAARDARMAAFDTSRASRIGAIEAKAGAQSRALAAAEAERSRLLAKSASAEAASRKGIGRVLESVRSGMERLDKALGGTTFGRDTLPKWLGGKPAEKAAEKAAEKTAEKAAETAAKTAASVKPAWYNPFSSKATAVLSKVNTAGGRVAGGLIKGTAKNMVRVATAPLAVPTKLISGGLGMIENAGKAVFTNTTAVGRFMRGATSAGGMAGGMAISAWVDAGLNAASFFMSDEFKNRNQSNNLSVGGIKVDDVGGMWGAVKANKSEFLRTYAKEVWNGTKRLVTFGLAGNETGEAYDSAAGELPLDGRPPESGRPQIDVAKALAQGIDPRTGTGFKVNGRDIREVDPGIQKRLAEEYARTKQYNETVTRFAKVEQGMNLKEAASADGARKLLGSIERDYQEKLSRLEERMSRQYFDSSDISSSGALAFRGRSDYDDYIAMSSDDKDAFRKRYYDKARRRIDDQYERRISGFAESDAGLKMIAGNKAAAYRLFNGVDLDDDIRAGGAEASARLGKFSDVWNNRMTAADRLMWDAEAAAADMADPYDDAGGPEGEQEAR